MFEKKLPKYMKQSLMEIKDAIHSATILADNDGMIVSVEAGSRFHPHRGLLIDAVRNLKNVIEIILTDNEFNV